jgi:hypothetical protein
MTLTRSSLSSDSSSPARASSRSGRRWGSSRPASQTKRPPYPKAARAKRSGILAVRAVSAAFRNASLAAGSFPARAKASPRPSKRSQSVGS